MLLLLFKLGTNETTQVSFFMKLDHEKKREFTDIGIKRPRVKSQNSRFWGLKERKNAPAEGSNLPGRNTSPRDVYCDGSYKTKWGATSQGLQPARRLDDH